MYNLQKLIERMVSKGLRQVIVKIIYQTKLGIEISALLSHSDNFLFKFFFGSSTPH